jgi:hypothetical protein
LIQILNSHRYGEQVLGYDHKFDSNYIVTVDASFNKDLNGVQVQNWGLKPTSQQLVGADSRAFMS